VLLALLDQLGVDPEGEGVQEVDPLPRRTHRHLDGGAGAHRLGDVVDRADAELPGEVVEGAAGDDGQRQAGLQRDARGAVDRAVPSHDAEHGGPGGGLAQRLLEVAVGPHHLGLREPLGQGGRDVVGQVRRAAGGVHDQHQALAVRQRGGVGGDPTCRRVSRLRRPDPLHRQGAGRTQRHTGHHVAGVVHAGVHPAVGDTGGGQPDRTGEQRCLQRHAGGERGGARAVAAREAGGRGLAEQLPRQRHGVQLRPPPAGRELGGQVGDRARQTQRGQTPHRRTALPPDGERAGDREPQQAVVGAARQRWEDPVEHRRLALGGGTEQAEVEGVEAGQGGLHDAVVPRRERSTPAPVTPPGAAR
jgi:hypothetical protein